MVRATVLEVCAYSFHYHFMGQIKFVEVDERAILMFI